MKQKYLSLIDSARDLITKLEAIGCSGFDYQRAGIIPDSSAFAIAEGIDTAIILLRDTIAACHHAMDIIDNKPYCTPLSDAERQLIEITGELINSLNCSTRSEALQSILSHVPVIGHYRITKRSHRAIQCERDTV